jgi:DNA-binding beta-propeller fold protein YncE
MVALVLVVTFGGSWALPVVNACNACNFQLTWGSVGTGAGQFRSPWGVAADASGNVYVIDSANNRTEKFTSSGTYVTQWGSLGSGPGQFDAPEGVAVDSSGNVYVVDTLNFRVEKFTSVGTYITQWGSLGLGPGQFFAPWGVAVDSSGNVYVVDGISRVQKFTGTGIYITQWGSYGSGPGQFSGPYGIAVDSSGNVYVVDSNNSRVEKFTSDGTYVAQWPSKSPEGVAVDSAGNVYVTSLVGYVEKFTSSGTHIAQWGSYGSGNGQFNGPISVAVDSSGNVYVVDHGNDRVEEFGDLVTTTSSSVSETSASSIIAIQPFQPPSTSSTGLSYVKASLLKGDSGYDLAITITPDSGYIVAMSGDQAHSFVQSLVNQLNEQGFSTPSSYLISVTPSGYLDTNRLEGISQILSYVEQIPDLISAPIELGASGFLITGYEVTTQDVCEVEQGVCVSGLPNPGGVAATMINTLVNPFISKASAVSEAKLYGPNTEDMIWSKTGSTSSQYDPIFTVGEGQQLLITVDGMNVPSSLPVTLSVTSREYAIVPTVDFTSPLFNTCNGLDCFYFTPESLSVSVTVAENSWYAWFWWTHLVSSEYTTSTSWSPG